MEINILLHNVAQIQLAEEKVCLMFAASTLTTVEGAVKLPVVHHLAVHAQLQTDALASSYIPAENLVRSLLPDDKRTLPVPFQQGLPQLFSSEPIIISMQRLDKAALRKDPGHPEVLIVLSDNQGYRHPKSYYRQQEPDERSQGGFLETNI